MIVLSNEEMAYVNDVLAKRHVIDSYKKSKKLLGISEISLLKIKNGMPIKERAAYKILKNVDYPMYKEVLKEKLLCDEAIKDLFIEIFDRDLNIEEIAKEIGYSDVLLFNILGGRQQMKDVSLDKIIKKIEEVISND